MTKCVDCNHYGKFSLDCARCDDDCSMYEPQEISDRLCKALDNENVLDKIRAEFISLYPKNYAGELELGGLSCVFSLNKILEIIDKYRAESEDEE